MAQINAPSRIHTVRRQESSDDVPSRVHMVRRLNFSEGLHWCENCVEGASREPAMYFLMTLERIEAEKSF